MICPHCQSSIAEPTGDENLCPVCGERLNDQEFVDGRRPLAGAIEIAPQQGDEQIPIRPTAGRQACGRDCHCARRLRRSTQWQRNSTRFGTIRRYAAAGERHRRPAATRHSGIASSKSGRNVTGVTAHSCAFYGHCERQNDRFSGWFPASGIFRTAVGLYARHVGQSGARQSRRHRQARFAWLRCPTAWCEIRIPTRLHISGWPLHGRHGKSLSCAARFAPPRRSHQTNPRRAARQRRRAQEVRHGSSHHRRAGTPQHHPDSRSGSHRKTLRSLASRRAATMPTCSTP